MTCTRCGTVLTKKDLADGKETCILCRYKFALGRQTGETKKALAEVERLKIKIQDFKMIVEAKNRKIALLQREIEDLDDEE